MRASARTRLVDAPPKAGHDDSRSTCPYLHASTAHWATILPKCAVVGPSSATISRLLVTKFLKKIIKS